MIARKCSLSWILHGNGGCLPLHQCIYVSIALIITELKAVPTTLKAANLSIVFILITQFFVLSCFFISYRGFNFLFWMFEGRNISIWELRLISTSCRKFWWMIFVIPLRWSNNDILLIPPLRCSEQLFVAEAWSHGYIFHWVWCNIVCRATTMS